MPRQVVEEQRLFHGGHQAVADAAENRVVGPDHQHVLARVSQLAAVVHQVPLKGVDVAAGYAVGHRRVYLPDALVNVLQRHGCHRLRVLAIRVDQKDRVENLHGRVRVERRVNLGDRCQVTVDEGAQPAVVLNRAASRTAADEQLEIRQAEGVLHVDRQQAYAPLVGKRGRNAVLSGPGRRLRRAFTVRHSPHLSHGDGVEVFRNGKLTPVHGCALHRTVGPAMIG